MLDVRAQPLYPGRASGELTSDLQGDLSQKILLLSKPSIPQLTYVESNTPAGILLLGCGPTSHAVIHLAGLGIPTVLLTSSPKRLKKGTFAALDGSTGRLLVAPDAAAIEELQSASWTDSTNADTQEVELCSFDALATADGVDLRLGASIASYVGASLLGSFGGGEISLLRTEFLSGFEDTSRGPDEHSFAIRKVLEASNTSRATIRLMDIGAEKFMPWVPAVPGGAEVLGIRGARYYGLPDFRPLLDLQLDAIEEVGSDWEISLLIPFVTSAHECKEVIQQLRLRERFPGKPIGAMAELPAICYDLEELERFVDFVALGLNDLSQTFFGADRSLAEVASYADPFAPSFHRFLGSLGRFCKHSCKEYRVCGRFTTFPGMIELLIGHGFRSFSVEAGALQRLAAKIKRVRVRDCELLAQGATRQPSARHVLAVVEAAIQSRER